MEVTFLKPDLKTVCSLPLYMTRVKAGFPSAIEDYVEQSLDLNRYLIKHPSATFFVRVEGNSMKDAFIHKGDILIVDKALDATNGKIIIAAIDGEFTVKRIRIENKQISLHAENPSYQPIQIQEETDFQIWGVVTYVIHKTC